MKTSFLPAGVALATCAAGLLIPFGAATAAPGAAAAAPPRTPTPSDVREVSPDKKYSTKQLDKVSARSQLRAQALAAAPTPPIGTVRQWLALDDFNGTLYRKDYTLRGVGDKIEVWVANDTAFPAGDCRGAASTVVTEAQVDRLVSEFDGNMYPKETATFSTPPDRDGTNGPRSPAATTPVTATRPSR